MRRACSIALLFALAAPVVTTAALAQQDDTMVEMARERFQEGVKFYDAKQYDKARVAFLQAYALKKHPAVLLNLAQSELRSGHEAEAAKHFAQYLRENTAASAMERQEAEKGLAATKALVAEFTVNVEGGSGAEVFVNGTPEGTAPLPGPIYVKPGNHNVEARRGGQTASQAITATAGQSSSVSLSFTGGGEGSGVVTGPGPGPGAGPGPGPGGPGAGGGAGFQVDTSQPRQPFFQWAAETPVAWVGGGLTVLGLAGGIGFALASSQSYDNADSIANQIRAEADRQGVQGPCGPPPQSFFASACKKYDDNVESGDSQKTLSVVSFVVAGVAAAGTIVYYFVDTGGGKKESVEERRAPRRRVGVVPVTGPGYSGLNLVGQF